VAGIESNEQQRMVVSAVVTLGRNLGKTVVAEGWKRQNNCSCYARWCSQFQGFGLSVPLSEGALHGRLQQEAACCGEVLSSALRPAPVVVAAAASQPRLHCHP
jgi:EAL domain-containing protein (putative c-di-GMP-specific phosphodiesterase class I)